MCNYFQISIGAYIALNDGMSTPTVYIVGAGPGDPELLTLKAHRLLTQAEAVVYDRLVSAEILALLPAGAIKIFAGKSCRKHTMTQEEIHHTLLALTKRKRHIVRLKGGDPYIFGRGGEEAEFLASQGIRFEVVPGISAASGCSAYGGIPLTHRGLASSVRYITGHRQKNGALNLDWRSLADPECTLVFYMALHAAADISHHLMSAGLPAATPVAILAEATTPQQQRRITTLAQLAHTCADMNAPATIIIGQVVALAGALDWFAAQSGSDAKNAQT